LRVRVSRLFLISKPLLPLVSLAHHDNLRCLRLRCSPTELVSLKTKKVPLHSRVNNIQFKIQDPLTVCERSISCQIYRLLSVCPTTAVAAFKTLNHFPSKNNIPLCATLHLDLGLFSLVYSQQHTSQLTFSILLDASRLSALAFGFSIPRQPRLSDRPCFLYLLGTRYKVPSSETIKLATSPSEQNKEQDSLVVRPS
jgi:hypothetical protein